ncbi:DUF1822 family protein [Leptothoe spongobia]|uniref:DUF1822 family protein n=1 Tax=Leptothoe spongobia TAU-MAC 1115 TaxID=1967444 RepID=A0A947DGP1_9CYAN|nr:DUF1822 family protein [Leptothoe spongobia]MBT9316595.1 DUF1822 family protein [Leptothoe spongobia TAU-MAC 1115]
MNTSLSDFTVTLTLEPHHQAEQFRQHQTSPQKAKQVYLNTLAIYATRFYLECLGYEPDLSASDGLNPVQQMLLGTSALAVKDYGQLECCPVVGGEMEFAIAPELHQDRIGYVAVHIDDSLRTATLLGFVTKAADRVSLSQLQPMETLSGLLTPSLVQQASEGITQLNDWLQDLADDAWQTLDSFVNPATLAFRNQTTESTESIIARSKRISLNEYDIILAVGLLPLSESQTEIQVQVYSGQAQTYLPTQLKLSVLDADNQEVMQAESRATEAIQLKFIGNPGEQFSLKLALGNASVAERFVI